MTSKEITAMFKATFKDASGDACLKYLKKTFVDRPMYVKGKTLDEVAFRQGQADVITQILKEINDGR